MDTDSLVFLFTQQKNVWLAASDSVTRVNESTRITICGDLDSTHVEKNGDLTRVTFFHKMTRLELQSMTRVRVIFTIYLSYGWTNSVRLHIKK